MAKINVAKIKAAKRPEAYTYSYLYNEIDLLCPDLSSDKINDLKSLITTIFNKKLKEEGGKSNKKKNKPTIKSGKMQNNNEKKGIYNQYADDNDAEYIEEEQGRYMEGDAVEQNRRKKREIEQKSVHFLPAHQLL